MAKYSVHQQPVETLLSWIKSQEIAIPEIQRPFVWKSAQVRDLIDSLYKGYPIGYIITWRNHDVKTKDGQIAQGRKILIDGQQRVTAITAAIAGKRVLDKKYKEKSINISFNPLTETFDVLNSAQERSPQWVNTIQPIVNDEVSISKTIRDYLSENPDADEAIVEERFENLKKIKNKQVGIIELDQSLDIDTVTEIFIRINQSGVVLSNADFVMSKIASDREYGGNKMRKLVDYFCRLITDRDFKKHIEDNDPEFAQHPYYQALKWMADGKDDLYRPEYADILRVAFTNRFSRGKFSDLVALLSGRNFETRKYEEEIARASYGKLEAGLLDSVNQTNYQRFLMLLESAGFISTKMISSKNSINFAYALFLKLRNDKCSDPEIQHFVKSWLIISLLIGRYSGSSESKIDEDIKLINDKGIGATLNMMEETYLGEGFWEHGLVQNLETSSTNNNAYNVYVAAQVYFGAKAFLSDSMTISSLLGQRGDIHHIFPRGFLKSHNFSQRMYNQVANYVHTEQATNTKIGMAGPVDYMGRVKAEITNGHRELSSIKSEEALRQNLEENDLPHNLHEAKAEDYEDFLIVRRKKMAAKIKNYYAEL